MEITNSFETNALNCKEIQTLSTIIKYLDNTNNFDLDFDSKDNETIKDAFSSFISVDMRSFSSIENTGFINVCKTMYDLGRKYPLPHQSGLLDSIQLN